MDALLKVEGRSRRAYPLPGSTVRVTCHIGTGVVRYATVDQDGNPYIGIHLDGDPPHRVDEVPAEHCRLASIRDEVLAASRAYNAMVAHDHRCRSDWRRKHLPASSWTRICLRLVEASRFVAGDRVTWLRDRAVDAEQRAELARVADVAQISTGGRAS